MPQPGNGPSSAVPPPLNIPPQSMMNHIATMYIQIEAESGLEALSPKKAGGVVAI